MSRSKAILALLLCWIACQPLQAANRSFPEPASLKPAVEFWKKVYTRIDTDAGYIHDRDHLQVVYGQLNLKSKGWKAQNREIRAAVREYKTALKSLGSGKRNNLSKLEHRILLTWGEDASNETLRKAADNVRFQRGQANKFKAGLIRSGAYLDHIRSVLRDMDLPEELAALPHVESSFDPHTRSHAGAAGMWQFTRSTGRRFMRIDHVVDERLDPDRATVAAARLLKHNNSVLESWPLALTAYNHGLSGMRRAVRVTGTKDIGEIVERYNGRLFGFASRNFYAAFLAALEISGNHKPFFGDLKYASAPNKRVVVTENYLPAVSLAKRLGISLDDLRSLNPPLQASVWRGDKFIPKGFHLRLPENYSDSQWQQLLADASQGIGYVAQRPDRYYRVRRGDTLGHIAQKFGTSSRHLKALNNLRSSNLIRVGQRLKLPGAAAGTPTRVAVAQAPARPAEQSVGAARFYKVRSGDNLSTIAARHKISLSDLLALNKLNEQSTIRPGQNLRLVHDEKVTAGGSDNTTPTLHVVRRGDTLSEIATRYGMSTETLAAINDLGSGGIIRVGQEVRLKPFDASSADVEARTEPEAEAEHPAVMIAEIEEKTIPSPEAPDSLEATAGPVETQPELAADPSDYAVADDGTVEVQAAETLGHYADWLAIRTSQLRRVNGLRYGQGIGLGERVKLIFSKVEPGEFERRRHDFHATNQAEFFNRHEISGTCIHPVQAGDSLWGLATASYRLPLWLLRQYNPDLDLSQVLSSGDLVTIPVVLPKTDSGSNSTTSVEELGLCQAVLADNSLRRGKKVVN
jgi:membrane-bound lytic murein transglycosylase D